MNTNTYNKLQIGLLIDTMIGGGAERITLNLFNAFTELGYSPHIILVSNKIEHQIDHIPNTQLHWLSETGVLSKNKMINKIRLAWRLNTIIKSIETETKQKFFFFISSAEDMDRLTRIAKVPNVLIRYRNSMSVYIQNKVGKSTGAKRSYKKWRFTHKFRKIYEGRDIVTVSNALEIDIVQKVGVAPRTIKTIYNPFNFQWLHKKAAEPANLPTSPYIIYAARFENRKRHDVLMHAYKIANPSKILVVIGGIYTQSDRDEFNKIKNLAIELGISEKVIFPGFQKNPYPWIKNADLFAMSSDSEGLPTVLIESLILGTPVVSTNCPTGPSEILTGELKRFLSPIGDKHRLAQNIKSALTAYPEIHDELLSKYDHTQVSKKYISHAHNISQI